MEERLCQIWEFKFKLKLIIFMTLDSCFIVNLFNVIIINFCCIFIVCTVATKLNRCIGFIIMIMIDHNHNHDHNHDHD